MLKLINPLQSHPAGFRIGQSLRKMVTDFRTGQIASFETGQAAGMENSLVAGFATDLVV